MRLILRQRNFALLWYAQLISFVGDWVLFVALPFYVYDLTGSALATGGMFIANALPSILLGSVAGVFADRWDRRRMMIVADLMRAALLLPILLVGSADTLWLVYAVGFCQAMVGQFFFPAKNALIPQLVGEEQLVAANALNSISESATRLIGPSLGGMLMTWGGISVVVLADAASFALSAFLIALITVPASADHAAKQVTQKAQPMAGQWKAGIQLIRGDQVLRGLFAVLAFVGLADALFTALLVVFTRSVLGLGAQELGWLMAVQGMGGLLGGALVTRLGNRLAPSDLMALGGILVGLGLLVIVNVPILAVTFVFMSIGGILIAAFIVGMNTVLQTGASDEFRGRIFGAMMTANSLARVLGLVAASVLGDSVGAVPVLDAGALLWIVSGIVAWRMMPRAGRTATLSVAAAE